MEDNRKAWTAPELKQADPSVTEYVSEGILSDAEYASNAQFTSAP